MVGAGESRRPTAPGLGSFSGKLFGLFAGVTSAKVAPVAADGLVNDRQEIPVAGGLLPIFTRAYCRACGVSVAAGPGGVLFVGDAVSPGASPERLAHL